MPASLPKSWFGPTSTWVTTTVGSRATSASPSSMAWACQVCARNAVTAIAAASTATTSHAVGT